MMQNKVKKILSERGIWILVCLVFSGLLFMLIIVANHEKDKPKSPSALVAAAFNDMFIVKEWKPGMGDKPFMYHPAAANKLMWQPLPERPNFMKIQPK